MKPTHIALLLSLVMTASPAAAKEFRAGAFAIDVTPLELPVIVNGGMTERVVDKVEDRLHARCLVLDDGTTQLAIVIVDSCMMPRDLLDDAKRMASEATKIPPQHMLIAATHTHSAPSVFACLGSDADEKYSKFLPVQIAKGIQQAHANLQPARIGWAVGRDDQNVASRRWLMQPGVAPTNAYGGKLGDRVMMHPGPANKNAIAATGFVDADVPVLSLQTPEGQPLAILTNYSLHYVGAPNLSADYFAVVCDKLRELLKVPDDQPFVGLHSNGTSGDVWLMDYTRPRRKYDRFQVGAEVAAAALEAYERIQYFDWVPLVMAESELELAIRQPSAEELAKAAEAYSTFKDRKPKNLPEVYARETVLLSQLPAKRKIKLQALRLGELGIAAIPNEVFSSTGLQIKIESPTPTTFTIELANGAEGYIAPPKQHKLGGYETWRARSSCLEVNAEPKIRAEVLALLNKVNDTRADEPMVASASSPVTLNGRLTPPARQVASPLSPKEAIKHFQIRDGYQIDLVASEPQIVDPVAFDWGFDGRLWVVEMHDYPNGLGAAGPNDKGPPGGRVKVLEDADGDGRYEKSTLFADGLSFPNGIMTMPDGSILVTASPNILRLKDTNDDGKADEQQVLFSGFAEGNQQLRVNGLKWGLDGWIYCASGGVGRGDPKARIKVERTGELVDIGGRDFRFSLDYKQLEPQLGMSQFGRNRDDFGNWFGCNNNTPLYHIVHDDAMLRRNPHLAPHATTVFVPTIPKPGPVYAISGKGVFWHDSEVGRFTSANSAMIYRDRLLGDDVYGNFFVSEPVHNLVHREIMVRDGVTFQSHRSPGEEQSEFLASTDTWFRPNMIRTGPDGALYISDMYREIIEHPGWIQAEKKANLTFRKGDDRGRIWRVTKKGVPPRKVPRIDKLSTDEIVQLLADPSGELRDMAQRWLVVQRPERAIEELTKLWETSLRPASRAQVMQTLGRFKALTFAQLSSVLDPSDPDLCACTVALLPAKQLTPEQHFLLLDRLTPLAEVPAAVRFQLGYELAGHNDDASRGALVTLLNDDDPFVREAALTSVTKENLSDLAIVALPRAAIPTAIGYGNFRGIENTIGWQCLTAKQSLRQNRVGGLTPLAQTLDLATTQLRSSKELRLNLNEQTNARLDEVLQLARRLAKDKAADAQQRAEAIGLVGYAENRDADLFLLSGFLSAQAPAEVQQAALTQLVRLQDAGLAEVLLARWPALTPGIRTSASDAMLSREPWTHALLAKLESGEVRPADLDASRRQRLLEHPNAKIKARAAKVLASSGTADRQKVLAEWAKVLNMPGDLARGKAEFTKRCATCHKFNGEGQNVGPDLNTLTDRSAKTLLTAVLDPNLAVEPKYQAYSITTSGGQVLSGMLLEETATSLTLVDAGGKQMQVSRGEIEELKATGRSLMPEGMERDLTPEALADILRFLAPARKD